MVVLWGISESRSSSRSSKKIALNCGLSITLSDYENNESGVRLLQKGTYLVISNNELDDCVNKCLWRICPILCGRRTITVILGGIVAVLSILVHWMLLGTNGNRNLEFVATVNPVFEMLTTEVRA